jgi:putative transposase
MLRVPRYLEWTQEAANHVLNRGHERETVFADDEDRQKILDLVDRYHHRYELRLYHYCLMTNHYHLLVQLDDPRVLSPMMARLQRAYVHYFHRRYQFVGHLWQGRFKSPAIQRDPYWLSCGRYIERNPLEADLVEKPWQYPWSSAPAYALGESNELLTEDPEYVALATDPAARQRRWQEFSMGSDSREKAIRETDWAVGDEAFRRRMQVVPSRPLVRRRGRPTTSTN